MNRLPSELSAEAAKQFAELAKGVSLYQSAPYRRAAPEPPVIWRRGAARLLDYSVATRSVRPATVFLVPSLINRYYILDLEPGRSFVRYLNAQGFDVLMLDWGAPGEAERGYDCADYVQRVLVEALRFAHGATGEEVMLAGYCMGGVLSLAAALQAPEAVRALALFATPWDFHAPDVNAPRLDAPLLAQAERWLDEWDYFPPEPLQMLFYWHDPFLFEQKFRRLARMNPASKAFHEFVALERWVNDGVPLTRGVARDCLIGWAQKNILARGEWRAGGKQLMPERWKKPAFIATPTNDSIVPPGCALDLARRMPHATLERPTAGHVGMMVGSRARKELWEPFGTWAGALAQ